MTTFQAVVPPLPIEYPRGRFVDTFPLPAGRCGFGCGQLTAVTIFTTWRLGPERTAPFAAACACGIAHVEHARHRLRKAVSEHRCVDSKQGPVELVPCDDYIGDDDVERLLAGLRALP